MTYVQKFSDAYFRQASMALPDDAFAKAAMLVPGAAYLFMPEKVRNPATNFRDAISGAVAKGTIVPIIMPGFVPLRPSFGFELIPNSDLTAKTVKLRSNMTFSFALIPTAITLDGSNAFIFSMINANSLGVWCFISGGTLFAGVIGGVTASYPISGLLTANVPAFVGLDLDYTSGDIRLYINDTSVPKVETPGTTIARDDAMFCIGGAGGPDTNGFAGYMGDIFITKDVNLSDATNAALLKTARDQLKIKWGIA